MHAPEFSAEVKNLLGRNTGLRELQSLVCLSVSVSYGALYISRVTSFRFESERVGFDTEQTHMTYVGIKLSIKECLHAKI